MDFEKAKKSIEDINKKIETANELISSLEVTNKELVNSKNDLTKILEISNKTLIDSKNDLDDIMKNLKQEVETIKARIDYNTNEQKESKELLIKTINKKYKNLSYFVLFGFIVLVILLIIGFFV